MSSSRVHRRFAFGEQAVPVGSEEYIRRIQEARRLESTEEQRLQQLREQAKKDKALAYQEGLAAGRQEGLAQGKREAEQVRANLHGAVEALLVYRRKLLEDSRQDLFELAFALADRIVAARAEREQDIVLNTIFRCIGEILDKSKIKIRVNPAQAEFVKANLEQIKSQDESIAQVTVEADARVDVGGCLVETDSGSADGRLTSQLQMLHRQLLGEPS
jgi:flagellar assembly protein FliH